MERTKLSIIIPAYNEELRIENVVLKYCSFFPDEEIIVVCNGCEDNTPDIVRGLAAENKQLKLLNIKEKVGKGGATIAGFKVANGDIIGFVDADESVAPGDVMKMINALSSNHGVIGSRWLKDSKILVKQPLKRRIASRILNLLVRIIFSLSFNDTQCGAKLFKKDAIKSVLPQMTATGFEFDIELLWKLKAMGYRVIEFPITWKHSEGSTFKLSYAPKMFVSLLKVRFAK
jgi:glycosyltransferase involved in cell wall biosynthesis